ncbi:MAG: SDR family oxidoreductase [Ruminococcus sp.]|nr:SDR family oxidoreductase [Ruminococcus sp.]
MKTCIISGASSGIGRETAILISKKGMFDNIVLIGRNQQELERTKELMFVRDANISVWNIDLEEPEKIPDIIKKIYSKYLSIDCLLNIAGYTEPQPILSTSLNNIQITYAVNVFSPLILIREAVRYMKKNGGKIVNIASTAGMGPRPGWITYSSSKAAMISISQTLTEELAEYGIKVYCVSPGRCATKLRAKLAPDEDSAMIMQPVEVAKVITNLLLEDEQYLDGQNIVIRKRLT